MSGVLQNQRGDYFSELHETMVEQKWSLRERYSSRWVVDVQAVG